MTSTIRKAALAAALASGLAIGGVGVTGVRPVGVAAGERDGERRRRLRLELGPGRRYAYLSA